MDLMCQNVTSKSLSKVKCMEKYGNKFLIKFFKMMPPSDLNMMYNKIVELDELYLSTNYYF